jgi:hypothetical protein
VGFCVLMSDYLAGLKIAVSVVRFRPWPPSNLFFLRQLQVAPRLAPPVEDRPSRQ